MYVCMYVCILLDVVVPSPILYSLAKQAAGLGGYKIARQALDVMQNLLVPAHLQVGLWLYFSSLHVHQLRSARMSNGTRAGLCRSVCRRDEGETLP